MGHKAGLREARPVAAVAVVVVMGVVAEGKIEMARAAEAELNQDTTLDSSGEMRTPSVSVPHPRTWVGCMRGTQAHRRRRRYSGLATLCHGRRGGSKTEKTRTGARTAAEAAGQTKAPCMILSGSAAVRTSANGVVRAGRGSRHTPEGWWGTALGEAHGRGNRTAACGGREGDSGTVYATPAGTVWAAVHEHGRNG